MPDTIYLLTISVLKVALPPAAALNDISCDLRAEVWSVGLVYSGLLAGLY